MTTINNIGKKIAKGALNTFGWITVPEVMSVIKYCNTNNYDDDWAPFPEIGIFLLTTAITAGTIFGANKLYESNVDKKYSTKNISIEVKHNKDLDKDFLGAVSYASPFTRAIMMKVTKDITTIKTPTLEMQIDNTNIISFDENKGFAIVNNAYYTNDFRILKKKAKYSNDKDLWTEYPQKENNKINSEYEHLKQKKDKVRNRAIKNGNLGEIIALEDSMTKIQSDYELKVIDIKKTRIRLEKEMVDIVAQLNAEYFSYKNAPKDTALPGRDYNLSDIKK